MQKWKVPDTIIWDIFNKGLSIEHNNIHTRVFVQNNLFKKYKRSSALYAIFDLQFVLREQACLINYQNFSVKISGDKKLRKIKIVNMMINKCLLLSIVEREGFKELSRLVAPNYIIFCLENIESPHFATTNKQVNFKLP